MHREEFAKLLAKASDAAIHFARNYISQPLSPNCRYHVLLNQSHDGNATPDEVLYPEDDGVELTGLDAEQVIDLLSRDRRCPEWIDVSVKAVNPDYSLLELLCCGRFADDPSMMYYTSRGMGPFGIKSPPFPPGLVKGQRFLLPTI